MIRRRVRWVTPKKFDSLFASEAEIVEFDSEAAESEYEERDTRFIDLIRQTLALLYPSEREDERPHQVEDWWPNHTRYLELCERHIIPQLLPALHKLLTHPYHEYRIQLVVYGDSSDGKTYIGSAALYADHLVVERALKRKLSPFTPKA